MKQISSKLKMQINRVDIINNSIEGIIFNFLLWSFGVLAVLYVIFLGNMVRNIVARQSLESQARVLSNEVSSLELTYLSMSNNVDLALSYSLGFKESKPVFTTRKSLGLGNIDGVKIAQNDL
jgi:hypothetical protein